MPDTTPIFGLPFPEPSDPTDVPGDLEALALAVEADLNAHLTDTTAAHAASAISFTPAGNIAATNVQAAIAEVDSELDARLDALEAAFANYVPTLTQGVAVTKNVEYARHKTVGKVCTVEFSLAVTSSGTLNSLITVGLPVAPTSFRSLNGQLQIFDASAGQFFSGSAYFEAGPTASFYNGATPSVRLGLTGSGFTQLASGDVVTGALSYPVA